MRNLLILLLTSFFSGCADTKPVPPIPDGNPESPRTSQSIYDIDCGGVFTEAVTGMMTFLSRDGTQLDHRRVSLAIGGDRDVQVAAFFNGRKRTWRCTEMQDGWIPLRHSELAGWIRPVIVDGIFRGFDHREGLVVKAIQFEIDKVKVVAPP